MTNLGDIPFECTRGVSFYYNHPTKGLQRDDFKPGVINRKSPELVGKLLSQRDSYGVSPLERHIEAGTINYLDDDAAVLKVEGRVPIVRPPLPPPLQAAAKAYAETKDTLAPVTNDQGEIEERARQVAIDASKRAGRVLERITGDKRLEHGKAVDVDELAPGSQARVTITER